MILSSANAPAEVKRCAKSVESVSNIGKVEDYGVSEYIQKEKTCKYLTEKREVW